MSAVPDTVLELRAELRAGGLSAREVAAHFLARAEEAAGLGAFVALTPERAHAEAAAADERWAATDREARAHLPPLHGIPLAHKDLVDVAGAATTHGSAALKHRVAPNDAPAVATLRGAGALSLGKTQVPELGLTGYSENLVAPPARNPLDPERTPGGSSGGSAAAVAAGLLPAAPGSDGGGSIRIPALACGLVGLKPGLGTVPTDLASGLHDANGAPRLTVTGPLARTAADAAVLFDAQRGAGAEPALAAVRRAGELAGLRIGMSDASPFASAHPVPLSREARAAYRLAAERLESLGHHLEDADIHHDPRYPAAFTASWTSGLATLRLPARAEERLTPFTREFRERALRREPGELRVAGEILRAYAADVREQWGRFDAVLTPGLAMIPPRIGAFLGLSPDDDYRLQCEWAPYTSMVNVSGLPAIAVPVLRLPSGHAMGAQLIGPVGSELRLLQLAAQLETLAPDPDPVPGPDPTPRYS